MNIINKIYIINKKENYIAKDLCETQLLNNGLTNYTFVDAVYPSEHYNFRQMYDEICKNMTPDMIKNNFSIGALGCMLSHIKVLKHALENNYKTILILENDFIIVNNFIKKIGIYFSSIKNTNIKWDFIYLGKKQGQFNKYDIIKDIHNDNRFINTQKINEFFYTPNYQTWGTHAILIKNTLFKEIINFENNIIAPIDITLMGLYKKYHFLVVKNDLFISDESQSDILVKNKCWNWNIDNYNKLNKTKIENIIILDYKVSNHTHKYIHKMYYDFFNYYYPNIKIYWEDNLKIINNINFENTLFFISPCHTTKKYDLPKNAYYIIHLDNISTDDLDSFFNDYKDIYNAKKYIILTCRKGLYALNYFDTSEKYRSICMPWFSEKLYNEIDYINNNLELIYHKNLKKKYFCYFGSIWNLNINIILELINVFSKKPECQLLLKGRMFGISEEYKNKIKTINKIFKNITFDEFYYSEKDNGKNTFTYVDEKFGIKVLLPIQGINHNNNYISNRIFETLSFGYLIITNCKIVKDTFKSVIYNENINDLLEEYIHILNDKNKWIAKMREQYDEFIYKFYGYNNIKKLLSFLQVMCKKNNNMVYYDDIIPKKYVLWIRDYKKNKSNKYFKIINTNNELIESIKNPDNYILNYKKNEYDIFLIDRIIQSKKYTIYIDNVDEIINCNILTKILKNTEFELKNNLDIYSLISGQRCGSTLIIDILQKYNCDNTLALSKIFNNYNNNATFTSSYDVAKGILKGETIISFNGFNMKEYFQQFVDLAEFKNYKNFVFKLTFDFTHNKNNFTHLEKIIDFISLSKINVIYLDRNDKEAYISKKLADIYGYANVNYQKLPNKIFSFEDLNNFIKNKIEYMELIHNTFKINKYITYDENENIETCVKKINDILGINIDYESKNYIKVNSKENAIDKNILLKKQYWV
jgi:GR25 family glycosyltransferase involved in LPS biosynthesis